MLRSISPLADAAAVIDLVRVLRRERPTIVHAHTPKAGLIAMVASWLAAVPCRIFHLHGHPHSTAVAATRFSLKLAAQVSCALATRVLSVSDSVRALAVDEGLCSAAKIVVPGNGSVSGVDAFGAFNPIGRVGSPVVFPPGALVIGFAGRLVRDKGVCELHTAWQIIRAEFPNAYLAIAGAPEERDALPAQILHSLRSDERVRILGWTDDMPAFYASIDVLALPSFREGLPTVVLEAAAMRVPTVAARSVGCVDAVIENVTGLLVEPGDPHSLAVALKTYLGAPELRTCHGRQARERVLRDFRPEDVWRATLEEYRFALHLARNRKPVRTRIGKRLLDLTLSLLALTLLSPLLALIAFSIRLTMGAPVFFRQTRPGLNERPFRILKFRTMLHALDFSGRALPDAERLTGLGRFLRAASLDELPELWNVLRGEMSLVGPRPLLPQYLPLYSDVQRRRHEVKPGITGWAQVNGRNALSWREKFEYDVWYVDHWSLALDVKILWRTLLKVVRHEGISSEGHATMPEFTAADR